ncbi:alpha-crystallin domain-containing protein 22.3 [Malania oleifera]|uniref:alpha-crystallin domain-containing protein 22.3 n=1 Tax=Malania oleifera TaxID=397392 RepID=UPI0025ADF825|nr:alpha-crystallin domain-containing protein 22.3 [Malania oleifera]
MAPPGRGRNEANDEEPQNHPQDILNVTPLNSMPYVGPPLSHPSNAPSPAVGDTRPAESSGPAMVFLPSHPEEEEWDKIVAATKWGVGLTGSAAMGKVGPTVGLVDIGECEDSYMFRVSLPGVASDENDFSFNIEPDGKVVIKGVTTTGERIVCKHSQIFEMQTQNMCPPGHFSVTFHLPGPVDKTQLSASFGIDGVLQGVVKKRK